MIWMTSDKFQSTHKIFKSTQLITHALYKLSIIVDYCVILKSSVVITMLLDNIFPTCNCRCE